MLVLSRKAGEQIQIGNDITIEVRRVSGNRVALAVQAPRDVRILRSELKESALGFDGDEEETTMTIKLSDLCPQTAVSA
ncbi:hypothetical protein Pla108_37320 [Botrimarina colliarenosi]|uniref:Translational regulator CsrA n=1 Tax=Botrimarina colliarenosi TaxID=2528001 RepID=A0A5C6A4I7_9BACT|nr:carbon storage regulator [Botrimarina colliarenosi]TWT94021.1 hypothetical protein Pla108_37320 [Botrimarina colliarenosi]